MKLEVGIVKDGMRLNVVLQSSDVETHSIMTDNPGIFQEMIDKLQDRAIHFLTDHRTAIQKKAENSRSAL
jgi:hypothetical protein